MIVGFLPETQGALPELIAATLGSDAAVLTSLDADGQWMQRPDVIVIRDWSRLGNIPAGLMVGEDTVLVAAEDANQGVFPPEFRPGSVITAGLSEASTYRGVAIDVTLGGTEFDLVHGGETFRARVRSLGESSVVDALVAVGVAAVGGVAVDEAVDRVRGAAVAQKWRLEIAAAANGVTIINDAAEATADTTAAALKTLSLITYGRARAVAVLGELTVAPEDSRDEHDRIGRLVVRLNVGKLVVVGQSARHIHNAAGLEGSWDGESVLVDTQEEAYDLLREQLREGDVVLVKSSESAGLGFLGDRLGGKLS